VVPSCDQRVGSGSDHDKERHREYEDPPAVPCERAYLLAPPDRRQPAEPDRTAVAGCVADGPQDVDDAEERHRDPDGRPGALGDLRGDRGDGRERDADACPREPERERPGRRQPRPDQAEGGEQAEYQVGADGHEEGGCQRGVPADDRRAHELEPAGLLLGAGVPDYEQDGEHRDQRPAERAQLDHRYGAERGLVIDQAVQRDQRRRVVDTRGGLHSRLDRVVDPGRRGRRTRGHGHEDQEPHREHDPVAAQSQAHQ